MSEIMTNTGGQGDQACLSEFGDQARSSSGTNTAGQGDRDRGDQARSSSGTRHTLPDNSVNSGEQATKLKVKKCSICSQKEVMGVMEYTTRKVRHHHFSSRFLRECVEVEHTGAPYFCPTCMIKHASESAGSKKRLKICISDSTLHKFWLPQQGSALYAGDALHIDWLTIPEGKISDLITAWEIEYLQETRPMDVLFVGGLNNIIRGHTGPSILRALTHFMDLVRWQGEQYHPEFPNTCGIGTLLYPPKLCWLEDAGASPPSFFNNFRNIKWLNRKIEDLNTAYGMKVPNFPTFGVRKLTKFGKETTRHRREHWAEDGIHLVDKLRVKMGKQVAKYFMYSTEN